MKVLVVDDSTFARGILVRELKVNNIADEDIVEANSGATALQALEQQAATPGGQTGYVQARLTASSPPAPPPAQAPARAAKPSPRRPKKPAGEDQGWKIVK